MTTAGVIRRWISTTSFSFYFYVTLFYVYVLTFMHFKSQHSNDTESTSCREFYGCETYGADNYILPELRNVLWLTPNEFPTAVDEK